MSDEHHLSATEVHGRLSHPVIDGDGHWQEYLPVVLPALERIGGAKAADGFARTAAAVAKSLEMSVEQRSYRRLAQQAFWGMPANALDRATAMMPKLLYERLDEFGLDFTVLYPTQGLSPVLINDAETRRATCRAFNTFCAEYFSPFTDRMTPAAIIPMHDPNEAVAELTFVKEQLGLKVVLLSSLIRRPVDAVADGTLSGMRAPIGVWQDVLGIDSVYDYDEVWACCAELGLAPTFHMGSRGSGLRNSPTNFVYNHIGHFAQANEAVCKALFLGGVTKRFPSVRFGFLEGGVGWAANLLADLVGHWEKRCRDGLEATNPANLDRAALVELADRYADADMAAAIRAGEGLFLGEASEATGGIADLDDYSACGIVNKDDIRRLFVDSFAFGCEADDPINAWGFKPEALPFGARLAAIFGSDIGHFDVPDMADVLPEAYELVEDGLLSEDDFADFTCNNAIRFFGAGNPSFFEGTSVYAHATAVLART